MKRLFFSLYFVVAIAIVFIGWSTDFVWQHIQTNSNSEITQIAHLSNAIQLVEKLDDENQQKRLADLIGAKVSLIYFDDVAWLDENIQEFNNNEPVLIYDEQDNLSIYIKATIENFLSEKKQLIKIGPITIPHQNDLLQRFLIIVSYLMLALVIGLWSWPLWRDLRLLQQATEKFGNGNWQAAPKVSKKSVIAPVVKTFKKMSSRISRLIEEQKDLSNAISHELRTPLARLKFSLALVDQEGTMDVDGMRNDVYELESLVDEMLSYSRLESITDELVLTKVNVNQLVENLVEKLKVNCSKKIELEIKQDIFWFCDGHYLERALQNLITNGIHYATEVVLVSVSQDNSSLTLNIEDDGVGIKKTQLKNIFKPFVRLDKSRVKKSGGFGLGLAIVKRIIEKHRGNCHVSESALGGAKFSVILPLLKTNE